MGALFVVYFPLQNQFRFYQYETQHIWLLGRQRDAWKSHERVKHKWNINLWVSFTPISNWTSILFHLHPVHAKAGLILSFNSNSTFICNCWLVVKCKERILMETGSSKMESTYLSIPGRTLSATGTNNPFLCYVFKLYIPRDEEVHNNTAIKQSNFADVDAVGGVEHKQSEEGRKE